jgi:hypothetical protein
MNFYQNTIQTASLPAGFAVNATKIWLGDVTLPVPSLNIYDPGEIDPLAGKPHPT